MDYQTSTPNAQYWQYLCQAVLSDLNEGIALFDSNFIIYYCNDALSQLTQLSKEAILTKPIWEIFTDLPKEHFITNESGFPFKPITLSTTNFQLKLASFGNELNDQSGGTAILSSTSSEKFIQTKAETTEGFSNKTPDERNNRELALELQRKDEELESVKKRLAEITEKHEQHLAEKKLVEEKLSFDESFIKQVADATPDVLYVFDLIQRKSLYINREIWEKLGYTPEEFYSLGNNVIQTITHPEDLSKRLAHFEKIKDLKDGEVLELEYRVQMKKGNWLWVRTRDSVFKRTPDGEPCQIMGVTQDITERKLAEEKLLESQRFIQQIADAMPDVVYVFDLQKEKCVYANQEIQNIFGYTADEILAMDSEEFKTFFHPDDSAKRLKNLESFTMAKDNEIKEIEYRIKNSSGKWHWVCIRNAVFKRTLEGKPYQIIGIVQDITEKKLAAEELRTKTLLIEETLSNLPLAIYILDKEGTFKSVNGSALTRAGIKETDLIGKSIHWLFPNVETAIQKALSQEAVNFQDYTIKKGKKTHFLNHCFYDEKNENILGITIDITVQKEAEEKLMHREKQLHKLNEQLENRVRDRTQELIISEERFRLVSLATNDAIWDWDLIHDKTWWNDGFTTLFGYLPEEIEAGPESWYLRIHGDDLERVVSSIHQAIDAGGKQWSEEYRFIRKDGSVAYVLDRGYILYNEAEKPIRMLGSMTDLTKLKEVQLELEQKAEALRQSNAELEQYTYIASHDLQEPLNTMSSFAKLLSKRYKDQMDADADEFISFIVDASGRMKTLINNLLQFSRINRTNHSFASTDISKAFAKAIQQLKSQAEEAKAQITCDNLPVQMADDAQIVQLFSHLLTNAIKFRDEKPLQIHISASERDNHWLYMIKDTGIGIDMAFSNRIFQLFQRLHTRDVYPGTGIGLAICKKIVERHGGTIWVESSLGEGSTFYFTLKK